jgi:hypothetical protein
MGGTFSHLVFDSFSVLSNSSTESTEWFCSPSGEDRGAVSSLGGTAGSSSSSLRLSARSLRRYHHQQASHVAKADMAPAMTS